MSGKIQSIISTGSHGIIVDIECHLSNSLPGMVVVGSASRAVDEAKDRLRGAFANAGLRMPRKKITINLAPADIPKADSGFDLGMAVAILAADGQLPAGTSQDAFIGELGLDGQLRPVRGIIGKLLVGRAHGLQRFFIPAGNLHQAQMVPGVQLVVIEHIGQLAETPDSSLPPPTIIDTGPGIVPTSHNIMQGSVRISEIAGQAAAKRALMIAAAGGHNVLLSGPPGTGKSMLAKALASVLPPLVQEEILEVTQLHSLSSHDYEKIVASRPFRAPHHSASQVAVLGGGMQLRPGEISLAHRGVLFFDELPEFGRATLEALRQPLEDRVITIARAKDTADYPADFILIATANPCPCGYYATGAGQCRCTAAQIMHYNQKLSGPILDRIDLYSEVHAVEHDKLLTQQPDELVDQAFRDQIIKARLAQAERYGSSQLNNAMTNEDIRRYAPLEPAAKQLLGQAAERLQLSARAYMRAVKVARTIADLDGAAIITKAHISEALAYRQRPKTVI